MRQSLGDDLFVPLPALLRAVLAEVDIAAVQPDDGETGRLVEAVLRDSCGRSVGHGLGSSTLKSGNYHFSRLSEPLCPTQAGTLSSVRPRDYIKAGDRIRTDDVQLGKLAFYH